MMKTVNVVLFLAAASQGQNPGQAPGQACDDSGTCLQSENPMCIFEDSYKEDFCSTNWYQTNCRLECGLCTPCGSNNPNAVPGCFTPGEFYTPVDGIAGEGRSVETSAVACHARCSRTDGCAFFSLWDDGGCHLQNAQATKVEGAQGVTSGRMECQEPVDTTVMGAPVNYCNKNSYGRTAGTVGSQCPDGKEKVGMLCYDNCPAGYVRFGVDCHQTCPEGFRDDGLFCRPSGNRGTEYGRGVGYAWFDAMEKCESDHGEGKCEWWALMTYPKCDPGYHNIACCICRRDSVDCGALGMNNGFPGDISCAKKIILGVKSNSVTHCRDTEERDGALCYPKCKRGFNGIGPMCWEANPVGWEQTDEMTVSGGAVYTKTHNWVECGLNSGSAKNDEECQNVVAGKGRKYPDCAWLAVHQHKFPNTRFY